MSKLLNDLAELGGKLAEEHLPDPSTVRQVVGGLVHFIESGGSLEPPVAEAEKAVEETADETIVRLEQELAAAEAAKAGHTAPAETPEEKAARLERELAAARSGS